MSDLRKAIEELADKWEVDGVVPISELREALDANPEPEPEWEIVPLEDGKGPKLESEYEYWNGWVRRPRTAPGPWIEVGDDE